MPKETSGLTKKSPIFHVVHKLSEAQTKHAAIIQWENTSMSFDSCEICSHMFTATQGILLGKIPASSSSHATSHPLAGFLCLQVPQPKGVGASP